MKEFFGFLVAWMMVISAIAGVIVMLLAWVNHGKHVSCLRLHEATSLETRYVRSGPNGECYIKIGDQWMPEKNWRQMEGS